MATVELIYDADCPNVEAARANLRCALGATAGPRTWREWRSDDPHTPDHARGYGSPTVLVNGRDVAGEGPTNSGACCRLYARNGGRHHGVPPVELLVAALHESAGPTVTRRRRTLAVTISSVGAIGAGILAALGAACCIGPLAVSLLGVSGAIAAARLTPYTAILFHRLAPAPRHRLLACIQKTIGMW